MPFDFDPPDDDRPDDFAAAYDPVDDEDEDVLPDDDEPLDLIDCPVCGEEVWEEAEQCPNCGEYIVFSSNPWRGRPWWWLALAALGILAMLWVFVFGL